MIDACAQIASHSQNAVGTGRAQRIPVSSDAERPVEVLTINKDQKLYYCIIPGGRLAFCDVNTNLNIADHGRTVARTIHPVLGFSIPDFVFDLVDQNQQRIQLYGDEPFTTELRSTEDGQAAVKNIELTLPKGLNTRESSRLVAGDYCVAIMGRYTESVEKHVKSMKINKIGYVCFCIRLHVRFSSHSEATPCI